MKQIVFISLITILALSLILPAHAAVTTKATVDDSLFITYDFANLDQATYQQAITHFNQQTIPNLIVANLENLNLTLVRYGFGPEPLLLDNDTRTINTSFFLSGSDIITFTVNQTSLKRNYQVTTEWRKFKISLSESFSIDFFQSLATPVEEWSRSNATTFHYENQTSTPNVNFYIQVPQAASNIQVQGDTIFFDMPPSLTDQLLDSPFLILGAIAVALVIVVVYRKAR